MKGENFVPKANSRARKDRSALTLGEAIHEITKNRGSLYDPDAVDACKRLFIEGRFAFKS